MADNITVNQGTAKAVAADDVSSVYYQRVKIDIGVDGSANAFLGTLPAVTNLEGGTVEAIPLTHEDSFGSVGTIGATATGTIHAAVSGSVVYVTDLFISSEGDSTVTIGDGTPTSPLLGPLFFGANGGCVSNFKTPLETTAGSALVYNTGGGTISVTAKGYID